jgi:xylulokinase
MSDHYLMGIDVGTTGTKAAIFTASGEIVAQSYREYGCTYPKPGWVEQDVDMLVAMTFETAHDALKKSALQPAQVAAISFSSQRCCTIFVDAADKLVRPMISWQDNRTAAEVELIKESISPEAFYDVTLLPLNTTWMISKILWLQRHEPESWKRTAKVVQLHDYILKAWGAASYFNDFSDAGFYGCWDSGNCRWDERLMKVAGLSPAQLPEPRRSGTPAGGVSSAAAVKTGLRQGTPLCIGAGDQNAGALGAGVTAPGLLSVSLGTGGALAACVRGAFHDPARKTMVTNHVIPGCWQVEGYQAGAASVFRWFRDEIAELEDAYAKSAGKDTYELLNEMVAKVPAGAKGLLLMPYFASAATPRWNSSARGTLVGLTFAHDRNCLARAFMEGITLEVNDMLLSLVNAGVHIDILHILGGPTKSDVWNQIQADIYGRPVCTLRNTEAAVTGAAILAGAGIGLFPDIAVGASSLVKIRRTYEPDAKTHNTYRDLYALYQQLYGALDQSGFYQNFAKFQHDLAH